MRRHSRTATSHQPELQRLRYSAVYPPNGWSAQSQYTSSKSPQLLHPKRFLHGWKAAKVFRSVFACNQLPVQSPLLPFPKLSESTAEIPLVASSTHFGEIRVRRRSQQSNQKRLQR